MRVGIIFVYMDIHRKGQKYRGALQPQVAPLIAGLLPPEIEIDVINDTWMEPPWDRDYDLLFLSCMHSDFDRTRQISHYWRRRGAKTVFGGTMAATYPDLCRPFFDAIVVGDAEGSVPQIYQDFLAGDLQPLYVSSPYDPNRTPVPRLDLIADQQVVPLSFEATRGCPFACDFCALTGIGTRFHVRPVENILRDIREGTQMLRDRVPWYKLKVVGFLDNNIGGSPAYLRQLCEAMAPLGLVWGSGITFNVLADLDMVKLLSRSGCRAMFMGLESLNPATIKDMHKYQNALDDTRRVLDQCRKHGILVEAPILLSPVTDDLGYIHSIPDLLRECNLHLPIYISIECPIPGTPHFHRLAEEGAAFLPNARLADFNGYTLVTRPKREAVDDFAAAYDQVQQDTYGWRGKWGRLAQDVPEFLGGGYFFPVLADVRDHAFRRHDPHPDRTYVAGTDVPFPELTRVPLTDSDFDSEEERRAILEPWHVTDEEGRVLPAWLRSIKVYEAKGRISAAARQLVAVA